MNPAVTVLQLDTAFPRVPGDVACPDTYLEELQILSVKNATVERIVSDRPNQVDIAPFEAALKQANGQVVVTSCGFLSYWQAHLDKQTDKPFISSALTSLSHLSETYKPDEILILTFDAARLNKLHFGQYADYATGVVGLPAEMHLRKVITENLSQLDTNRVIQELSEFIGLKQRPHHKHLLLECTNLPPYKAALQTVTQLPVSDILTQIEAVRAGTIQPAYLVS
ncbi:hypothetical protein BCF46_0309 [Litoreibacter meonggei]|uniref:Aspartate/glutamate racemase n=1 Tax=Litoreibacter meonggei TaxID=1049199 RepID=A0A497X4I6_9RHOB|nr:hypothetical protein [Litoreibacter meonggei]RLJ60115.1 hypothetical protein BCF46_0309 [Litoreibacter meonggei]